MDDSYKKIINLIQQDFPIESRPFLKIANKLNMEEEEVIKALKEMKTNGYIRRIGGSFDSKKIGYHSTLCAAKVSLDKVDEVAAIINSYNEVTHNYIRQHSYNMWFTVIASSKEKLDVLLKDIKYKTGVEDILELPAINLFKIKVNFQLGSEVNV
jgi:DNA-binding Lrp family transcriptional regulator